MQGSTLQDCPISLLSNLAHGLLHIDGDIGPQVDISVTPGTHSTEAAVNKQLNDKERVAAALENPNLVDLVNRSLVSSHS